MIFDEYLNQQVKVNFKDGESIKIARGILEAIEGDFIKVTYNLVINKRDIIKINRMR